MSFGKEELVKEYSEQCVACMPHWTLMEKEKYLQELDHNRKILRYNKVLGRELSEERLQAVDTPPWCTCQSRLCNNKWHTSSRECYCCREILDNDKKLTRKLKEKWNYKEFHCITCTPSLVRLWEIDNLEVQIYNSFAAAKEKPPTELEDKHYSFAAYRIFVFHFFGNLCSKLRIPLPSCVVNSVRQRFPTRENSFVSFSDPFLGEISSDGEI